MQSLPVLLIAIALGELIVTNHLAGLGNAVAGIDRRISVLSEENERLAQEVASASSLLSISVRAHALGLVESTDFLTVVPNKFPVALNPRQ